MYYTMLSFKNLFDLDEMKWSYNLKKVTFTFHFTL